MLYGLGRTWPSRSGREPRLRVGVVAAAIGGSGRLLDAQATFTLQGTLTPGLGLEAMIALRVIDPGGRLRAVREPGPIVSGGEDPTAGSTYVVLRGQKADPSVRTEYGPPPAPDLVSLVTPAQMRSARYRFSQRSPDGLGSRVQFGQVVADLIATVTLDITAPPGTLATPNFFTTHNVYTFHDATGETLGTIVADIQLGRSFGLVFPSLPDQPAMRYGGIGPIVGSSGIFTGVEGTLFVNSAIGIAPHALSMLNVLRIEDPDGRWRLGGG